MKSKELQSRTIVDAVSFYRGGNRVRKLYEVNDEELKQLAASYLYKTYLPEADLNTTPSKETLTVDEDYQEFVADLMRRRDRSVKARDASLNRKRQKREAEVNIKLQNEATIQDIRSMICLWRGEAGVSNDLPINEGELLMANFAHAVEPERVAAMFPSELVANYKQVLKIRMKETGDEYKDRLGSWLANNAGEANQKIFNENSKLYTELFPKMDRNLNTVNDLVAAASRPEWQKRLIREGKNIKKNVNSWGERFKSVFANPWNKTTEDY